MMLSNDHDHFSSTLSIWLIHSFLFIYISTSYYLSSLPGPFSVKDEKRQGKKRRNHAKGSQRSPQYSGTRQGSLLPPHPPRLVPINPPAPNNGCSSISPDSKKLRQLPRARPGSGTRQRNAVSKACLDANCHAASGF